MFYLKSPCTNLADGLEVLEKSKKHKGLVWIGLEHRFMAPIQSLINHVSVETLRCFQQEVIGFHF